MNLPVLDFGIAVFFDSPEDLTVCAIWAGYHLIDITIYIKICLSMMVSMEVRFYENLFSKRTCEDGVDSEFPILKFSQLINSAVGYNGEIIRDQTKPDGMMCLMVDSSKINVLGWQAKMDMKTGLRLVYEYYLKNKNK